MENPEFVKVESAVKRWVHDDGRFAFGMDDRGYYVGPRQFDLTPDLVRDSRTIAEYCDMNDLEDQTAALKRFLKRLAV